MSTIPMIDISHSMILYGEDRITPAKSCNGTFRIDNDPLPKGYLDILFLETMHGLPFIKDLPYLKVGPYHTTIQLQDCLQLTCCEEKRNTVVRIFMDYWTESQVVATSRGTYYVK
jgi:hypothetical protein